MGTLAMTLRALLVLAAALVLVGCELRADVDVRVDRDGAGSVAFALATDEALGTQARAAGFDFPAAVAEAASDLDGWDVEASGRSVELATEFADPDDLRWTTAAFADALAGPELRPLEPFEVTVSDDRVRIEGAASLEPASEAEELGVEPGEAVASLGEAVDYTVSVELPGEILRHDADRREGNVLAWDVPAGERVELTAEAERPPAPPGFLLLAVAAGGALVLVVVGLALVARRRRARRGGPRLRAHEASPASR